MAEHRDWAAEEPPTKLFRYRPPTDIKNGFLDEVLLESKIFATSPTEFNDPFDCRVQLSFEGLDPREVRKFLDKQAQRLRPNLKWEARKKLVTRWMRTGRWKDPEVHDRINQGVQSDLDGLGVICFSESGNVPLMWSHYSTGHQGFCLCFKAAQESLFREACRVRYSPEYPRVSAFAEPEDQVEAILLTKADWWGYEREWRFIGFKAGRGHRPFPPEALESVILGYRMTDDDKHQVLESVQRRNLPVDILQAKVEPESYRLVLEEL